MRTAEVSEAREGWRARLLMMGSDGRVPPADVLRWVPLATEHDLARIAELWDAGHHAQAWAHARDVARLEAPRG